jgi:hypothetical protein
VAIALPVVVLIAVCCAPRGRPTPARQDGV